MAQGSWYDVNTDGTFLNGILYPGDDNSWWNRTPADVAGDVINDVRGINNDNTLSQSRYGFNYKSFPADLGMDYLGHYMVININVPTQITSPNTPATNFDPPPFNVLPDEMSKVDVLRFGVTPAGYNGPQSESLTGRRTRRIVESIALYMPGTQLVYTGLNDYEEVSMTALGGQLAVGGAGNLGTALSYAIGGVTGGAADALLGIGDKVAGLVGGTIDLAAQGAKLAGRPITPRVEVLFSRTQLREFTFEFNMVPRNREEALAIDGIIKTIRFHAAPELMSYGWQYIPPAEFDITFYHNGLETDKLPRINTCVLKRCEVDYAPGTGVFTTFRDGHPVATRLMLVFQEVEAIHKLRIAQGL